MNENEFLIVKDDKLITYQIFRKSFWNKSEVLKSLPTKHLPHDGRHSCATMLDDAEVLLKIRQMILGHTSKDITDRVYTHKTIQQLIDAFCKEMLINVDIIGFERRANLFRR